jgi:hypothetical protein
MDPAFVPSLSKYQGSRVLLDFPVPALEKLDSGSVSELPECHMLTTNLDESLAVEAKLPRLVAMARPMVPEVRITALDDTWRRRSASSTTILLLTNKPGEHAEIISRLVRAASGGTFNITIVCPCPSEAPRLPYCGALSIADVLNNLTLISRRPHCIIQLHDPSDPLLARLAALLTQTGVPSFSLRELIFPGVVTAVDTSADSVLDVLESLTSSKFRTSRAYPASRTMAHQKWKVVLNSVGHTPDERRAIP